MSDAAWTPDREEDTEMHVLLAYDGSPPAIAAIEIGSMLLPAAEVTVANLWMPPFASEPLRHRLRQRAHSATELADLLEREGSAEAERLVASGVVLATAAGWQAARPLVRRSYGGDGFKMAALAEELEPDVLVSGTRQLTGPGAVLDSFTDLMVHHSPRPALVVPHPLLTDDRDRVRDGPVVVGWDGSTGAAAALESAAALFGQRELVTVAVGAGFDPAPETAGGRRVRSVEAPARAAVPGPGRGAARGLLAAAGAEQAGVLVVGSRGGSALREVLLGSTAMAVLHHADLPVVVVPHRG